MGYHTSHWLSYFSRWLEPPTVIYIYIYHILYILYHISIKLDTQQYTMEYSQQYYMIYSFLYYIYICHIIYIYIILYIMYYIFYIIPNKFFVSQTSNASPISLGPLFFGPPAQLRWAGRLLDRQGRRCCYGWGGFLGEIYWKWGFARAINM